MKKYFTQVNHTHQNALHEFNEQFVTEEELEAFIRKIKREASKKGIKLAKRDYMGVYQDGRLFVQCFDVDRLCPVSFCLTEDIVFPKTICFIELPEEATKERFEQMLKEAQEYRQKKMVEKLKNIDWSY